jgi:hypothetical protein
VRLAVGGPWKGAGMAIRLGSTVINCADLEGMTRFWAGAPFPAFPSLSEQTSLSGQTR